MHHAAVRSSKRQPKDIGFFYDSRLTFLPKDFNWQIWRNCVDGEYSSILALLDHLVRPRQHVWRDRETDLLGGFQIDHELELCRLPLQLLFALVPFNDFISEHGN
jgi:hypothetical protein